MIEIKSATRQTRFHYTVVSIPADADADTHLTDEEDEQHWENSDAKKYFEEIYGAFGTDIEWDEDDGWFIVTHPESHERISAEGAVLVRTHSGKHGETLALTQEEFEQFLAGDM